jgi:NADH:ubiquinone oxidoreductase subunit E
MDSKTEIVICLGSSCFSRGNGKTLTAIKKFLETHKLDTKVFFHGELCTDQCEKGPILKIGDKTYSNVNQESAIGILKKHFQVQ